MTIFGIKAFNLERPIVFLSKDTRPVPDLLHENDHTIVSRTIELYKPDSCFERVPMQEFYSINK